MKCTRFLDFFPMPPASFFKFGVLKSFILRTFISSYLKVRMSWRTCKKKKKYYLITSNKGKINQRVLYAEASYSWCFSYVTEILRLLFSNWLCTFSVSRCLKITEKVSFNIGSEASYVYILSGQKFIKDAKNCPFWRVFENLKLAVKQCYQTGQF